MKYLFLGCPYGDFLEACNNLQPHLCYSWNSYCCATCPEYYIGVAGVCISTISSDL